MAKAKPVIKTRAHTRTPGSEKAAKPREALQSAPASPPSNIGKMRRSSF